ncbi:lipase maturation factor 2-like [Saccoglossus kowalevskii]
MAQINMVRDYYLWCMSVVYLFAFGSLYNQVPGLYGKNGILPAHLVLKQDGKSVEEAFVDRPTLLWFMPRLGLDVEHAIDMICILGILISFICMLVKIFRDTINFALLWFLYFSVYQVGQTFLWFQWDILLLEVGFLTILVAPLNLLKWKDVRHYEHDAITMWLLKWMLFRLMFASGIVKLTSQCETWWGLTALTYHYETQCIPTPLAWYAHHLPVWFQKLSVVFTYVIEIALPFLFFSPIRTMRIFAGLSQVFLMLLILLTGNYNFFNLLTAVLCLSTLDDNFFQKKKESRNNHSTFQIILQVVIKIIEVLVYGGLIYWTIKLFSLKLDTKNYGIKSSTEKKKSYKENESVFIQTPHQGMDYCNIGFIVNKEKAEREYDFMYKPGNVSIAPPIVAPHQPRLDWQMWFAALGDFRHNPWFIHMVYRLLKNEPDVIALIEKNPYPDQPPRYIRAQLYHYYFTSWNERTSRYLLDFVHKWWRRKWVKEYMPTFTLQDESLMNYLKKNGIVQTPTKKKKTKVPNFLKQSVITIRDNIGHLDGFNFLAALFVSGFVINIMGYIRRRQK